jgi:hypothetical protein
MPRLYKDVLAGIAVAALGGVISVEIAVALMSNLLK